MQKKISADSSILSPWMHSLCDACYLVNFAKWGNPVRSEQITLQVCCNCGSCHRSGIYMRMDPKTLQCKGKHKP